MDDVRKQLLELPDISKIDVLGAEDERVMWSSRPSRPRASGSTAPR